MKRIYSRLFKFSDRLDLVIIAYDNGTTHWVFWEVENGFHYRHMDFALPVYEVNCQ